MTRITWLAFAFSILGVLSSHLEAGDVSGRVIMPDVCSPGVSPAVATLEPIGEASAPRSSTTPIDVALINQRGLQFVPRVQAISLGQTLRFTNDDIETHNVHILSPGNQFNDSMGPGQQREFTPVKPGVVRLGCDVHAHMRGYVVVSSSPWVAICSTEGLFKIRDVPEGRYTLTIWHEMGDALKKEIVVGPGKKLELATLSLEARKVSPLAPGVAAPVRPWSDVIDRISVLLGSSLDSGGNSESLKKAVRLAGDCYFVEFEGSEMETAVRLHLGIARASSLERKFRAIAPALRAVSTGQKRPSHSTESVRDLLFALVEASRDLNTKGVTDASHLKIAMEFEPTADDSPVTVSDCSAYLKALASGLDEIKQLADKGDHEEASARMSTLYFDEFEPIERVIAARRPQDIRSLEQTFAAIRGQVGAGELKDERLASRLDGLVSDVTSSLDRMRGQPIGTFGPAFGASFVTALREGAEVILLLAMLIALAAKTGQAGAMRSIGWGVGLAVVASGLTAVALNSLVAAAQGRTREVVEGGVMLAASAVLFYVSYWLISQSESKRWTTFLKRQATSGRRGAMALMITAFLAVYREGAETALMYQAMIGSQGGSKAGLSGLLVGLIVGLVILGMVAILIRVTSVRLPLRAFFQVTGAILFAMAVVFAGNAVFALQESGMLKITPLAWLGTGLPLLGIHPSVQTLSVQALLLSGAALALVVMAMGNVDPKTQSSVKAASLGA